MITHIFERIILGLYRHLLSKMEFIENNYVIFKFSNAETVNIATPLTLQAPSSRPIGPPHPLYRDPVKRDSSVRPEAR